MPSLTNQRVLVTGGTGFVGSHVVDKLVAEGFEVRVLARRTSDVTRLVKMGVGVVYGDLADAESLSPAVEDQDVLVNVATTMGGTTHELELGTILGTPRLFALAREAGVRRLVHISSISVAPMKPTDGCDAVMETEIYETDQELCVGYVAAKQATEKAALAAAREGWEVFVLRPGIVFGPRGQWLLSRLGYAAGSRFFIVGDGKTELPSTYVENLADAVVLSTQADKSTAGIFHIIDDQRLTQNEYLRGYRDVVEPQMKICHLAPWIAKTLMFSGTRGKKILGGRNPFHRGHIEGCLTQINYSTERARNVLGWKSAVPKQEALKRSYADWKRQKTISRKASLSVLDAATVLTGARTRVAIIGCGGISDIHLGFLRGIASVEVVGCYDPVLENAQRLKERFALPYAASTLEELFDSTRPDAVHVLTPPQHTSGIALQCLNRGCHVLVEKPMAMDEREACEMAIIALKRGLVLCVDHNHIFDKVLIEARRLVETGTLGEITWVESYYGFDLGGNRGNPLLRPDAGKNWNYSLPGGLFQNLLPHPLGVALEFIPEPLTVRALARNFRVVAHQPNDELRVVLETPSTCGIVTVSLAAAPRAQTLQIYGTKGTVFVDFTHKLVILQKHIPRVPRSLSRLILNLRWGGAILKGTLQMTWKVSRKKWVHYDGMERLFREFYCAIRQKGPVPVTTDEALRVMRVMDETWRQIGPQSRNCQGTILVPSD